MPVAVVIVEKAFSDSISLSDAWAIIWKLIPKSFSDSISLSDVFSIVWKLISKSFGDSIGLSDAWAVEIIAFISKAFSDSIGISDVFGVDYKEKGFSDSVGISDVWSGNGTKIVGGIIEVDVANWSPAATFQFEVTMKYGGGAGKAYARLWNKTDGEVVAGSELSTSSLEFVRLTSGNLALTGAKEYQVQLEVPLGESLTIRLAKIRVKQVVMS